MTDIVNTPRDGDRLRKALDRLKINGGRTPAGAFLAFSITEPLFCYERDTQEELVEVIADTLKSYAETFYEVENVTVQITSETRAVPDVPVIELSRRCGCCPHSVICGTPESWPALNGKLECLGPRFHSEICLICRYLDMISSKMMGRFPGTVARGKNAR